MEPCDDARADAYSRPSETASDRPATGRAALRTCPNCGAELSDTSCKLVCPNRACGYFLSCSDFL
ncbi:MAG TPA: hypothetical protein VMT19_03530 [Thermoanaerobaculaceae bacterium]|nr:hypothetical protein [Thermoanaerobaculaceae bacterium]